VEEDREILLRGFLDRLGVVDNFRSIYMTPEK
jgi:hypothetical protein